MKNNFTDKQPKYSAQHLDLNKLGESRNFGNFYEKIHNRKSKVISFINKDIAQITAPDLRQFVSMKHAYEILMSYNLFYPFLYEDYLFINTSDTFEIHKDIHECISLCNEVKQEVPLNHTQEPTLACELFMCYTQRKSSVYTDDDSTDRIVKRQKMTKKNTVIRIQTSDSMVSEDTGVRINDYKFVFKVEDSNK